LIERADDIGNEFRSDDNIELIERADDVGNEFKSADDKLDIIEKDVSYIKSRLFPPWTVFIFLILLFITFDFWSEALSQFISQYFHEGSTPSWQRLVLYASAVTVIFVLIIWMTGIPIATFETL